MMQVSTGDTEAFGLYIEVHQAEQLQDAKQADCDMDFCVATAGMMQFCVQANGFGFYPYKWRGCECCAARAFEQVCANN